MGPTAERHVAFSLRAASLRLALGFLALTLIPAAAPQPPVFFWILGGYLAFAAGSVLLIWKQIWVQTGRALTMGAIDYLVATYVVHQVGSAPSLLLGVYIFIGIMYALVVTLPVALALSIYGAAAYAALLFAEHRGWLPFAPAAPAWMPAGRPDSALLIASATLVTLMTVGSVVVVGRLSATLRAREDELERLSQADPLTGLWNRRHVLGRIAAELSRVRRGHPLSVIMIDLDGFKRVNDEHGHLHGDKLLAELASALRGATREIDVVGRFGGDEFVVILPDTSLVQAEQVAGRLLGRIRETGSGSPAVTASLGVAAATAEEDAESLLRRADVLTYRAKHAGGDRLAAG